MDQFSSYLVGSMDMKLELFLLSLFTLPLLGNEMYGGSEVDRYDKYPFIARLIMKWDDGTQQHCTGSLIKKDQILTAKHCFYNKYGILFNHHATARFGDNSFWNLDPNQFEVDIKLLKDDFGDSDLALAKLSRDVRNITTVPVSRARVNPGNRYTAVGFGMHGYNKTDGHLRDMYLEIHSLSQNKNWIITKMGRNKAGPCAGDSGGPLLDRDDDGNLSVVATLKGHGWDCRRNRLDLEHPYGDIWSSVRVM